MLVLLFHFCAIDREREEAKCKCASAREHIKCDSTVSLSNISFFSFASCARVSMCVCACVSYFLSFGCVVLNSAKKKNHIEIFRRFLIIHDSDNTYTSAPHVHYSTNYNDVHVDVDIYTFSYTECALVYWLHELCVFSFYFFPPSVSLSVFLCLSFTLPHLFLLYRSYKIMKCKAANQRKRKRHIRAKHVKRSERFGATMGNLNALQAPNGWNSI